MLAETAHSHYLFKYGLRTEKMVVCVTPLTVSEKHEKRGGYVWSKNWSTNPRTSRITSESFQEVLGRIAHYMYRQTAFLDFCGQLKAVSESTE